MMLFASIFTVFCKNMLKSKTLYIFVLLLILITFVFSYIPQNNARDKAGYICDNNQISFELSKEENFVFLQYDNIAAMKTDILKGEIECGYEIQNGRINAYYSDSSSLFDIINETVLCVVNDVNMPKTVSGFLANNNIFYENFTKTYENADDTLPPIEIEIKNFSKNALLNANMSLSPIITVLLYLLLIAGIFLKTITLSASTDDFLKSLHFNGSISFVPPFAVSFATCCLFFAVCLPFFIVFTRVSIAAYIFMFFTCLIAALLGFAAKKFCSIFIMLTPIFVFFNIIFSGTVINTSQLIYEISALKYLSIGYIFMSIK